MKTNHNIVNYTNKKIDVIVISDSDSNENEINSNKENDNSIIILSDSSDNEKIKTRKIKRNNKKKTTTISNHSSINQNKNNDDDDVIFICESQVQQQEEPVDEEISSLEIEDKMEKLKNKKLSKNSNDNYDQLILKIDNNLSPKEIISKIIRNEKRDKNYLELQNYDMPSIKSLKIVISPVKQKIKRKSIDLEKINIDLNSINNNFDVPTVAFSLTMNLKDFVYKKYLICNNLTCITSADGILSDQINNLLNANFSSNDMLYINEMLILLQNLIDSCVISEINLDKIFDLFRKLDDLKENDDCIFYFYKKFNDLIKNLCFNYELLIKNIHLWQYFNRYLVNLIEKCFVWLNQRQEKRILFQIYVLKLKIFHDLMFIYVKFVYEIKINNLLELNNNVSSPNKQFKLNWLTFQQNFSINDDFLFNLNEKFKMILLIKQNEG
jgi:hypothetical protein